MAKKGTKGKASAEEEVIKRPKIPPKKKKQKAGWNLHPVVIVIGVAVVANIIYSYVTDDGAPKLDVAKARDIRLNAMRYVDQNRLLEALKMLDESIALDPYAPTGYSNKAGVLRMVGRTQDALEILEQGDKTVTEHDPKHDSLWYIKQGFFYIYKDMNQGAKAIKYIKEAVELKPSATLYNSWASLDSLVDDEEKIQLYDKALRLEPELMGAFCSRYHTYGLVGDWDKLDRDHSLAENYMDIASKATRRTDEKCMQPYQISYLNFTAAMMRDTAKVYAMREANVPAEHILPPLLPSQATPQFGADGVRTRKLKVGYFSSDLRNHPVGRNVLGLLLGHNKEKYDLYAFVTKHAEGDPITQTIQKLVTYVDLTKMKMSHHDIAKMVREKYQIDVLVDLNGWTSGRMLEVFSSRPAPVQITHGLGFVGTSGVDAFQYFISDGIASPARFDDMYTEKVVRLPVNYLPAAHKKVQITPEGGDFDPSTTDKMALRKLNDLPDNEDVFVYCAFQSIHKISRESFDTWMRILTSSPNSVLWMIIKPGLRETLLQRAKAEHGIGPERFVWGGPKNAGLHIERAQACDLYLDAWPYNAHSTAADVIWAGVPIMVHLPDYHDQTFPIQVPKMCSRVSASLVHTLGMPQLIKATISQFEDEAVRLSNDREAYDALRNELMEKRLSSDLFNLVAYTRAHELAYSELYERFMRGEKPSPLNIPA